MNSSKIKGWKVMGFKMRYSITVGVRVRVRVKARVRVGVEEDCCGVILLLDQQYC